MTRHTASCPPNCPDTHHVPARPLYAHLAALVDARERCLRNVVNGPDGNRWAEMAKRHEQQAINLVDVWLPHGSGFDNRTALDWERSTPNHLVFTTSFHHMNDHGYYDGWTSHDVHVRPSLQSGIDIRVSGANRNDIKDHIHECFDYSLRAEVSL